MITAHNSPRSSSPRPGPQRRGTVLLMVIGVLALLAIIAVVYATLGRSDRATSAALVRERRIEDRSSEIARYVQSVIAEGVFATVPQRAENGAAVLKRKAYDFPWTDSNFLSIDAADRPDATAVISRINVTGGPPMPALPDLFTGTANILSIDSFRPTGSVRRSWPSNVEPDLRDFGTPFLAASEPTFLSHLSAGSGTAINAPLSPGDPFANRRDWSSITTIAPSGNFVNLANLRNNWDAESGWGLQFTLTDGTERRRMSSGLTLFQGGSAADAGKSYDLGRPGVIVTTNQPVPIRVGQAPRDAHPLRPADWSTNQIWAFRPMIDAEFDPGQYAYLFNQWADADGDGFADSRWTELVDVSAAFGSNPVPPRSVLPADGRVRYFIAARVLDASSMINVNTASDIARTPGQLSFATKFDRDRVYLPGASPADIDIRRTLMGLDFNYDYHQYLTQAPRQGLGYLNFPRPESAGDIGDYTSYDALNSLRLGSAGYMALQSFLLRGSTLVSQTGIMTTPLGDAFGGADENLNPVNTNGLRAGPIRRAWTPPGAETTGPVFSDPGLDYRGITLTPKPADLRLQSYSLLASRSTRQYDPGFPGGFGAGTAPIFGSAFGLDDELDLRKFQGVNDSASSSVLESVVGGRSLNAPALSPLRDNRPRSLENQGREFGGNRPYRHLFGPPGDELPISADGVSARRDQVLVGYFGDIRRLLTTHSGARPIIETAVRTPATSVEAGPLTAADLATDLTRPLTLLRAGGPRAVNSFTSLYNDTDRLDALAAVADVYMRSLLPFGSSDTIGTSNVLAYPSLWPDLTVNPVGAEAPWVQAAGLAWGGRAEIAARTSVHLALNLADAIDVDRTSLFYTTTFSSRPVREVQPDDTHEPTAVTLFMYAQRDAGTPDEFLAALPSDAQGRPLRDYFAFPPVYLPERVAPLVNNRTAVIDNRVAGPRALNMFGVEPQPFLIEATSMFLYTDAPSQAGGDVEPPQPSPIPGGPDVPGPVSVDLDARLNNPDFLGEVFAVQITNPFDDPLLIYREAPTTGPWQSDPAAAVRFYVRIGERYFLLAEQEPDSYIISSRTITLAPGETRVFYALNPGTRNQFRDRVRAVANARAGSDDLDILDPSAGGADWFARRILDRQLGAGAIQMPMINPETLDPIGAVFPSENATITGSLLQSEYSDLWSTNTISGSLPAEYSGAIPAGEEGRRRVVSLYRVMRSTVGPRFSTAGDLTGLNDPYNDFLVDRLRDPTGTSAGSDGELFARRPTGSRAGNTEIAGTQAGPDTTGGTPQDNTGFSMILWGTVRRPTAEGFIDISTGRPRLGVLPPWCIETKSDNDPAYGALPVSGRRAKWSLNATDKVANDGVGNQGEYSTSPTSTPRERFSSIRRMLGLPDTAGNPPPIQPGPANTELPKDAYAKNGNPIPRNFDGNAAATAPARRLYIDLAPEFHTVGFDAGAPDDDGTLRRSSRNAGLFSRVGDLLLPLGVGPWMDPVVVAGVPTTGSPSNPDVNGWAGGTLEPLLTPEFRWTSLAESLALATGYYSPAQGPGNVAARNLYANFGFEQGTIAFPGFSTLNMGARFDRGHLRLDAFTPYRLLANGTPTGNERREPIGAGIPFALNVLSNARIAYGVGTTLDDNGSTPTYLSRQSAAGSGTEATPGLLNINTAVRETLSSVPLLRPAPDVAVLAPGSVAANIPRDWTSVELTARELGHFGAATPLQPATPRLFETAPLGTTPPAVPTSATDLLRDYDVATTLLAYRDKSAVLARPFTTAAAGRVVDFSVEHPPASTTFPRPARAENAGLPGIREGLGFRSVGEIMAADYFRPTGPGAGYWRAVSITRMADPSTPGRQHPSLQASRFYPRDNTGRVDTVNFLRPEITQPARSGTLPLVNADVPTYASKLAIANAALGTISVRSDVFVCYFLVHGYTPEDVIVNDDPANGPVEPMTPSIAKRFVMVLDRSNVVSPGDTPKVLMLQEVPLAR